MLDVQNKPSKNYLGRIDAVQYHAGDGVMLLQVLGSNVTELALQLVLVLLGVGNTLVDAILVECCGGGCSWEEGR